MQQRRTRSRVILIVCFYAILAHRTFAQSRNANDAPGPEPGATTKTTEQEILSLIRGRLDALAHNDLKAWATYVADDMLTCRRSGEDVLSCQYSSAT
jgi:hypothetical protein